MTAHPTLAARIRKQALAGLTPAAPAPALMDLSSLRASLAASGPPAGPGAASAIPHLQRRALTSAPAVPDSAAVLASSPNARRLCKTYDDARHHLGQRGRMQRLGLVALVSASMVSAAVLALQQRIGVNLLNLVVLTTALLGVAALGGLAALWARDEHRRREVQGERLVRALGLNCSLARDRVETWLAAAPAGVRFFEVYACWRAAQAGSSTATG